MFHLNGLFVDKNEIIFSKLKKNIDNLYFASSLDQAFDDYFTIDIDILFINVDVEDNSLFNNLELLKQKNNHMKIILLYENQILEKKLHRLINIGVCGIFSINDELNMIEKAKQIINRQQKEKKNTENLSIVKTIFDGQKDLIFSIKHEDIRFANKSFFSFFDIEDISSFHRQYLSIQSQTVKDDLAEIYIEKNITTSQFIDHLYFFEPEKRTIALKDKRTGETRIFLIKIDVIKESHRLFTLSDVTETIKKQFLLEEQAHIDPLTRIFNRRKFSEESDLIHNTENKNYSLFLIDIDYFKSINDTLGHDIGDRTLKDLSFILKSTIRKSDILARWGGEEFIILSPGLSYEQGLLFADRIRDNIEKTQFSIKNITVSIGVAHSSSFETIEDIIKEADKALYRAKANGRNRVEGRAI